MIDVTVKTLDSQNHVFTVEEDISVRQFKEQISPTIAIPVDQQRLIFRGRVLQDDKKISEYNVANNTIHVVQRPANQNSTSNDEPPARPSSQAGNRMGDGGGIFIAADDGAGGGGGRNAIIMGAIGLPTFDVEGGQGADDNGHQPRRSGAQVRLMVGNQMLNRASNLLQQLEDDDSAVVSIAASSSPSSSASVSGSGDHDSPENEIAGLLNNDSPMDIDDDAGSIERMISQVVNVSSAAALVAAIRQVQPGASGSNPPSSPASTQQATGNSTDSNSAEASTATSNSSAPLTVPTATETGAAPTLPPTENNQNQQNQEASPSRRPESPRIRELSTALQDYLALQDRLTPFLRFLQDALRQNRIYTETGESQSTQFVFDTVSSILHLLGHSLHAFSEIMCDFSLPPENRRLIASSSILVEQSTVVRATIPVAVPAMLANASAAAAAASAGAGATTGNVTAGGNASNAQQQSGNPLAPTGLSFSMGPPPTSQPGNGNNQYSPFTAGITGIPGLAISMSAAPGVPLANIGPISGIPVSIPGLPTGLIPTQINRQWTNTTNVPPTNVSTNASSGQQQPSANSQQQQQPTQQQPNMQLPGGGMLPPGLHNLGALLGVGGAGGLANLFGAGALGGAGGAMPAGMQNPFLSFQQPQAASNNNNNNNAAAPNTGSTAPASGQQPTPNSNSAANGGENSPRMGGIGNNNGGGGGMLQNLLRNELNRPQFDVLLPCHTYHTSGRGRASNRSRPAEFRRFVNVEGAASGATVGAGIAEGETVEILMDLIRNSRLVDLLQPLLKDAVLNYLMRGRDPKNPVHVKTCAKGLVKKILPFLVKFSARVGGANESVDISATYLNILTGFLTSLMQKVIGQSAAGDGHFKTELINSLTDLQKQLILAFKVCYPNSTNVGLLFVDYLVEQCLGGMSIIFKNQVRQKLIDHLKQLETKIDNSSSLIVYKESQPAAPAATPSPIESSGNILPTASAAATTLLSSRCAASFGNTSSSSSLTSGIATEASSSGGSTPSKVPCTIPTPPPVAHAAPMNVPTDDLDIDEVLQLPPSMATAGQQQDGAAARRCLHSGGANAQGHSNHQTDSIASLMRGLPSEWADTVQQDIRRQVEMPSQQAFSPGYNTLFPRKH